MSDNEIRLNERRSNVLGPDYLNPRYQGEIASMEQSNDVTGDYGQIEQIILDDLNMNKGWPKLDREQVLGNPELSQKVVKAYWDRLDDFNIPNEQKAHWWLMPGRYESTQGDVSKLDKKWQHDMNNRSRNLAMYRSSVLSNERKSKPSMRYNQPTNPMRPMSTNVVTNLGAESSANLQ